MAIVRNNHTTPMPVPGGPVIPAGVMVRIDDRVWDTLKQHNFLVQTWLSANALEEIEPPKPAEAKTPVAASTPADEGENPAQAVPPRRRGAKANEA